MFPMDRKPQPIAVEYDSRYGRVTRVFAEPYAARRFYGAQLRAGNNPTVRRVDEPVQSR